MSKRARDLAAHLRAFHNRLMAFLEGSDEQQLKKVLSWEGFPILAIAGHISGSRHYGLISVAEKMIRDEAVMNITEQMAIDLANQDFEDHLDWTFGAVVEALKKNGEAAIEFVGSLSDQQLKKKGHIASYGGDITVDELIDLIIVGTSVEHLENMKRAVL